MVRQGRPIEALAPLGSALAIAPQASGPQGVRVALSNLGWALHQAGRLDEALSYITEALTISRGDRRSRGRDSCAQRPRPGPARPRKTG